MINREKELRFLEERTASQRAELVVMWGRRRLGKTTLLKALCEAHPAIYFLATRAPAHEQLQRLSAAFAEFFKDPLLERTMLPSWDDAFGYLARNANSRTVLAVDEFPYLVEADPAIPSRFQFGWDEHLIKNPNVMLLLNGSSLAMMEQHVLGSKSPLYGRRTGQWRIEPFSLLQFREFFPHRSLTHIIETYTVVGGVPFYALQFDLSASLKQNVTRHILSKGSVLFEEVPFLLREEVREPRSYFPILAAIAAGSRKFGEISSKTGFDKANLGKYLATLQDLRLVRRDVPITEPDPGKSRKGLYAIEDPFTDFWLRYVWPNLAPLEMDRAEEVWDRRIEPDFAGYVAQRCERFVGDLLRHEPLKEWLGFEPVTVGKYWDPGAELDLVALDRDGKTAVIAEVKWTARPIGPEVARKLRSQADTVESLRAVNKRFVLFSRAGFTDDLKTSVPDDTYLIDLGQWSATKP
jgi:AAA+ ATPase superfamily predicted ATPase